MNSAPVRKPPMAVLTAIPALFLVACLPGDGDGPDQPSGPMYRCIGEAPYQGTWEEIIAGVKANPPACKDGKPIDNGEPLPKSAGSGDSIRVHSYVMDGQCRFLTEFRGTLPVSALPLSSAEAWDMKDGNGKPVPNGEYYVNVEVDHGNGLKDSTYLKMGLIMNPCEL